MATFNTTGGSNFTLGSSIGSTDTSILLSSFTEPVSGVPYTMALINSTIVYGTISPQSDNSEFISFSGITQNLDGTALLTGVTRGLGRSYPYASSSTFQLPHAGQSIFILSDAPEVFAQYAAKANDEIITGTWTFNNFPVTPSNTPATTTVLGISKLSTVSSTPLAPVVATTEDPRIPVAYAIDASGSDAYAITPSPVITAYSAGQQVTFKAGTANTGASTINVNGLGAKSIKKDVSLDLSTGDILLGQVVTLVYDGTNFQLTSKPSTSIGICNSGIRSKLLTDASTTQAFPHNLGIIPKIVRLTATYAPGGGSSSIINTSIGIYNTSSGNSSCVGSTLVTNTGTGASSFNSGVFSIGLSDTQVVPTATGQTGIVTVDATNITITWTKNGAPSAATISFMWEAEQ